MYHFFRGANDDQPVDGLGVREYGSIQPVVQITLSKLSGSHPMVFLLAEGRSQSKESHPKFGGQLNQVLNSYHLG